MLLNLSPYSTVPPEIKVGAQMVGSPLGGDVTFQCMAEAQPRAITYWQRKGRTPNENQVLLTSGRIMQEATSVGYRTDMKLTITNVERVDIGSYRCVAKNPLGEADGLVHLHGNLLHYMLQKMPRNRIHFQKLK